MDIGPLQKKIKDLLNKGSYSNINISGKALIDLKQLLKDNEMVLKENGIDYSNDVEKVENNLEECCLDNFKTKKNSIDSALKECAFAKRSQNVDLLDKNLQIVNTIMNKEFNEEFYKETLLTKKERVISKYPEFETLYEQFDDFNKNMQSTKNVINKIKEAYTFFMEIKIQVDNLNAAVHAKNWGKLSNLSESIKHNYEELLSIHKEFPDVQEIAKHVSDLKELIGENMKYVDDFDGCIASAYQKLGATILDEYIKNINKLNKVKELIIPHSKVAELTKVAYMYYLSFPVKPNVDVKSSFDMIDKIISENGYDIEITDLVLRAVGCAKQMTVYEGTNIDEIFEVQKEQVFGEFCDILKQLKEKGKNIKSLQSDVQKIAKSFKAPGYDMKDILSTESTKQYATEFIQKIENKEINLSTPILPFKQYYQYVNCDSTLYEKEFESIQENNDLGWLKNVVGDLNKDLESMKTIINNMDKESVDSGNGIFSELTHIEITKNKITKPITSFEKLMYALEMIISTNGKKSLQQLPTSLKDVVNYYNVINCLTATTMIEYIKTIMIEHGTSQYFDAFNKSLILSLQSVVKTLRPFTEKFTSSNGTIHKKIEMALEPVDTTNIENDIIMYKHEYTLLDEIKEKVKELIQKDDLYSLTKALSYTSYIRMHYGYDKEAVELMEKVDQQCVLSSNFGFIPNIHLFTREVNPLFPQHPHYDIGIKSCIFSGDQQRFTTVNKNELGKIESLDFRNAYNAAVLVRNGYMAQISHHFSLHDSSQSNYSGLYYLTKIDLNGKGILLEENFNNGGYGKRIEMIFKSENRTHYKLFASNSIKPLFYKAYLACYLSQCPQSVPFTYERVVLPRNSYTYEIWNKLDEHGYVSTIENIQKIIKKDNGLGCCISNNYCLTYDSKSKEVIKQCLGKVTGLIGEYNALIKKQKAEKQNKFLNEALGSYDDVIKLQHKEEVFVLTKDKKGYSIMVNESQNSFLTTNTFTYYVNDNGDGFDFKYSNGRVKKRDDNKYEWIYHFHSDYNVSDLNLHGHTPAFEFETSQKVPEELLIILSYASKMEQQVKEMSKKIKKHMKEEKRQREEWERDHFRHKFGI
ncbi:putative sporulation-specific protein [Entamoeba marina]